MIVKILLMFMPWRMKRALLVRIYKYNIHPTAKIGISYIYPESMTMHPGAIIGHGNVVKGLSSLALGKNSVIGNLNWITGFPKSGRGFFTQELERHPSLIVGDESAITNRHLIDCTNTVALGDFVTFAGFRSQILSHSINLKQCRQASAPVIISDYCFIGSGAIILPGCKIGAKSIVSAGVTIGGDHSDKSGFIFFNSSLVEKQISIDDYKYFDRDEGKVV